MIFWLYFAVSFMLGFAQKWLLYGTFVGIAACTSTDYDYNVTRSLGSALLEDAQAAELQWIPEQIESAPTPFLEQSAPKADIQRFDVNALRAPLSLAAASSAYGAKWRLGMNGLPRNVRQVQEGYWLGARPTVQQLRELRARNVKVVLSATFMDHEQLAEMRSEIHNSGMLHINAPFGGKFPRRSRFWEKIAEHDPAEIYIHCEYGGDRTGAILAFLLATRHQWTIQQAFLAVAFPGRKDSRLLIEALEKRGYLVDQSDVEQFLGIYSPENNGGYGGLKVRSRGYLKLINTTIDAIDRINKKG